jgi:hypothetical protein
MNGPSGRDLIVMASALILVETAWPVRRVGQVDNR